ncbi:MAG: YidH family protein [Actinomycetes bacterium]
MDPDAPRSPEPSGHDHEVEPDVRFTYANERTFLAWNRTALALIATGVVVVGILPKLDVEFGRRVLGIPMILLGAYVSAASLIEWRRNEDAMRHERPLPRSGLPRVLTVGVVVVAVIAAVLALLQHGA